MFKCAGGVGGVGGWVPRSPEDYVLEKHCGLLSELLMNEWENKPTFT